VEEPGADLAVALALASAHRGEPLSRDGKPLACFGEVGLTGELRYVAHPERRVGEARKFGLAPVVGPVADEGCSGLAPAASLREALKLVRRGTGRAGRGAGSAAGRKAA
jgi:predicted ATP-dependent serine protease